MQTSDLVLPAQLYVAAFWEGSTLSAGGDRHINLAVYEFPRDRTLNALKLQGDLPVEL